MTQAFVGREDEITALHAFVAGGPRVLVVEGDAGIGKTTLVERFLAQLPDARVLRASGDDSRGEPELRDRRPAAALGRRRRTSTCFGADQHLSVGMELLERLGEHGSVVVVDDAHLADPDSLRALLFCARRLRDSTTLFILVVRGTAPDALSEGWLKLADGAILRPRPAHAGRRARARRAAGHDRDRRRRRAARRPHRRQPAAPACRPARAPGDRRLAARRPPPARAARVREARRRPRPPAASPT